MSTHLQANASHMAGPLSGLSGMQTHPQQVPAFQGHPPPLPLNTNSHPHPNGAMTTAGYADGERGRDREREEQPDTPMGGGGDGGGGQSATTPTTSGRKRRRSRKGMEKKFDCPHPGCGKFYSRAEHLYRHQLNREYSALSVFM